MTPLTHAPNSDPTALLHQEWSRALFTSRWRLYRSGYHLHARATWRRAHPTQREYQAICPAETLVTTIASTLPCYHQGALFVDAASDETDPENCETYMKHLSAPGATMHQHAQTPPKSRELMLLHEAEAKVLAARTQEIGVLAQTSLVRLLSGGDPQAQAFQIQQIAALQDELAPPGSRIEERLLAEVIAKARFETLHWQSYSADLIATGQTVQVTSEGSRSRMTRNVGAQAEKRAVQAEKRYLQALRELIQLRRLVGPQVQVNVANFHGEESPPHNIVTSHMVTPPLEE